MSAPGPGQRRCAVLGDPVDHSLSPALHAAAYAALDLPWDYTARRVPAGTLAAFLASAAGEEAWRGFSLTMPLKREVLPLLDEVGEQARRAGAANTVVLEHAAGGVRRHGDNTDVPGAAAAVRERTDVEPRTVTVLGGGATATSTALALCDLGARQVRLLVRAAARAEETAAAVAAHPAAPRVEVLDLATAPVVGEVVVSTVPAAAQDDALLARCAAAPVVFEVLYDPWPTPLQAAAERGGQALVTGLDLLVHQAVLQVELMTGRAVPLAAVRDAGEAAVAARSAAP
ncbi:shikimate dehydrogenase [Nocardioides perillae]|uniref:Shikimate dehydrogenase n=1 Tax=Nocardioides perillae TaxID=1119534 RepID=A0A7Y9RXV4_9ACTN|nr:shikimate dehydrogenase [Nocardioides perillae]